VTGAELAARVTVAGAVLGEFRRAIEFRHAGDLPPSYPDWAHRLAQALGDLLAWLEREPPALTPAQLGVLGQALADAIGQREPGGGCPDCDASPACLCEDHAGDLDRADAYLGLARDLGIEAGR
jgi:hypothetical protein